MILLVDQVIELPKHYHDAPIFVQRLLVGVWECEFIVKGIAFGVFDEEMGLSLHEVVDDTIKLNKSTTIECVVEHKVGFGGIYSGVSLLVEVVGGLTELFSNGLAKEFVVDVLGNFEAHGTVTCQHNVC